MRSHDESDHRVGGTFLKDLRILNVHISIPVPALALVHTDSGGTAVSLFTMTGDKCKHQDNTLRELYTPCRSAEVHWQRSS